MTMVVPLPSSADLCQAFGPGVFCLHSIECMREFVGKLIAV